MLRRIVQYKGRIIEDAIVPRIRWKSGDQPEKVTVLDKVSPSTNGRH
jgi:hypothetical protein